MTISKIISKKAVIGHVHLKVSNLDKSINFYTNILGFQITEQLGDSAAFLSAGGYHHHIGLNTWESKDGKAPQKENTGLYHFAILVPNRKELARSLQRLIDNDWPLEGAADHGVSEALYLRDPDNNGIEIYYDRPKKKWPKDNKGKILMTTMALDLPELLKELS